MTLPKRVRIVEVGPRDGLQNELATVDVETKVALIEGLAAAGLTSIEAGSFVSQKAVPQMASTAQALAQLHLPGEVRLCALTPNMKGLDLALQSGVEEIAVFAAASEAFSQRNINCSIAESLERFAAIVEKALAAGVRARGYVSCVLGCPYEGEVDQGKVAMVARDLARMGCHEISLGDTIGVGTPLRAKRLVERVAREVSVDRLALHFHDTYGQALANILACLELGVGVIDSSIAGLGGCPYAPGAGGNVATEDVVYMLHGMEIETGLDLDALVEVGDFISRRLGRSTGSKVASALMAKRGHPPSSANERRAVGAVGGRPET